MRRVPLICMAIAVATLLPGLAWGQCLNEWSTGTDTIHGIFWGGSAYYDGKVYVVGGTMSGALNNSIWIYDIAGDSWSTGLPFDATGWTESCVVAWDGKIFSFGGFNGTNILSNTKIYDIAANTWSNGANVPFLTAGAHCAVIEGIAYVAGGANSGGELSDNAAYDIAADSWDNTLADLPQARGWGAGVTDGTGLYVITGKIGLGLWFTTYYYDPTTNSWTTKANIHTARFSPGAAFTDGKLYIFNGGGSNYWDPRDTSEIYDIAGNNWSTFEPSTTVPVVGAMSAYTEDIGGLLFQIGGYDISLHYYNTNQIFSLCLASLAGIDPGSGANDADVEATVTGWGFQADDAVLYLTDAKTRIDLEDVTVVDGQTITASVPAGSPAGVYRLTIEATSGETDTLDDAYEVLQADDDDDIDDDNVDDDDDDDTDDDDTADDDDDDSSCCGC